MVGQERYTVRKIYLWQATLCGLVFGLVLGLLAGGALIITSTLGVTLLDDSFLNESFDSSGAQAGQVSVASGGGNSGDNNYGSGSDSSNYNPDGDPNNPDLTGLAINEPSVDNEEMFEFSGLEIAFLLFLWLFLSTIAGGIAFFAGAVIYNLASMIGCGIHIDLEDKSFESISIQGLN